MYGLKNCDTCRGALKSYAAWLSVAQSLVYTCWALGAVAAFSDSGTLFTLSSFLRRRAVAKDSD